MKVPPAEMVRSLRQQLRALEADRRPASDVSISSGCAGLDELLPGKSFRPGQLVEWVADGLGSGAGTLALVVARQACCVTGGALVVADRAGNFYPPAALAWGIDGRRLIVVRASREKDELWALDQCLRCVGVAAVWAGVERLQECWFRRLQLAAESGGVLGLWVRPLSVRGQPSWSDVQLLVQPRPGLRVQEDRPESWRGRRVRVELLRCRGGAAGSAVDLEIDEMNGTIREVKTTRQARAAGHETHPVHLASPLAHPASGRRSARA
jgi:protein ImuA